VCAVLQNSSNVALISNSLMPLTSYVAVLRRSRKPALRNRARSLFRNALFFSRSIENLNIARMVAPNFGQFYTDATVTQGGKKGGPCEAAHLASYALNRKTHRVTTTGRRASDRRSERPQRVAMTPRLGIKSCGSQSSRIAAHPYRSRSPYWPRNRCRNILDYNFR